MILTLILVPLIFNLPNLGTQSYLFLNPVTPIGYDAVRHNPANLALTENPDYSLRLVSINAAVINNFFSIDLYNQYLGTDSAINDEQKIEFLNRVPINGLNLKGELNFGALDFSFRNFGFAFQRVYFGNGKIPKELIDLLLFGNQLHRKYDLSNFSFDYIIYNSFNFAFALPVLKRKNKFATIGIGLKYLFGTRAEITKQALGNLYSDEYFISGELTWTRTLATGGYGFGIDFGSTYETSKYRFGLALLNLTPGIIWHKNLKTNVLSLSLDSFRVYRAIKTNSIDSVYQRSDTSFTIQSFRSQIPIYLTLGAGWKLDEFGSILSVIYAQNLLQNEFSTFIAKFNIDLKWNLLQLLIVNPSISLGGSEGIAFALGLGKNFRRLLLSFSLESSKSPNLFRAKGLKFSLSSGITPP